VAQIWSEVSNYIDKHMSQSKGVNIPNFGTFSFVQKKIDVGNSKFVLAQRPVFVIAEKFAQTHGLSYTKYPVSGNVPVHPLNYIAIANETPYSRDDVESCIRHILQVFNRNLQSKKNVELTFNNIGKLQIRNNKVKMKFFKDFVNMCDSTGKVLTEMQNRPHTADSVMSRNDLERPHTRNTCLLPR
jgi:nucleoid DNA-binding protein